MVGRVAQAGWFGDGDVVVEEVVALGVLEVVMRCFEVVHEEEGLVAVALL